jgi:hypothetical protein
VVEKIVFTGLISLIILFLGLIALIASPKNKLNQSFFCYNIFLFIWSTSDFIPPLLNASLEAQTIYYRWTYLGGLGLIIGFYRFVTHLLDQSKPNRVLDLIFYGPVIPLALLSAFTPLVIQSVILTPGGTHLEIGGPMLPIFAGYILLGLVINFVRLVLEYPCLGDAQRSRVGYTILALGFGVICCLIWFITLPFLQIDSYLMINTTELICMLIFAYAIIKHELMDVRIAVSRGVSLGIVGGLMIISFGVANALAVQQPYISIANIIVAMIWIRYARPLRYAIQTPLTEKWVKGWYDDKALIEALAIRYGTVVSQNELIDTLRLISKDIMGIVDVVPLHPASPIIKQELLELGLIRISDLSSSAQLTLTHLGVSTKCILMALQLKSEAPIILIFKQKLSEDPYTKEDIRTLSIVRSQTENILDRVRPYETIKSEFETILKSQVELDTVIKTVVTLHHEINNPLTTIRTAAYLLQQGVSEDQKDKHFELILQATVRIVEVIKKLGNLKQVQEKLYSDGNLMIAVPERD